MLLNLQPCYIIYQLTSACLFFLLFLKQNCERNRRNNPKTAFRRRFPRKSWIKLDTLVSLTSLSLRAKKPSVCVLTDTLARSGSGTLAFTWPVFWSASTTLFFVSRKMRAAPCNTHTHTNSQFTPCRLSSSLPLSLPLTRLSDLQPSELLIPNNNKDKTNKGIFSSRCQKRSLRLGRDRLTCLQ